MPRQRFADEDGFLDDEEREISAAIDAAVDNNMLVDYLTPERKAEIQQAAQSTLDDMRYAVMADVSGPDFCKLSDRAKERGTTKEKLLAEILHDYVEGRLIKAK